MFFDSKGFERYLCELNSEKTAAGKSPPRIMALYLSANPSPAHDHVMTRHFLANPLPPAGDVIYEQPLTGSAQV